MPDLGGKVCRLKARDYPARVIQHEVDHLNGIEFTDRARKHLETTTTSSYLECAA